MSEDALQQELEDFKSILSANNVLLHRAIDLLGLLCHNISDETGRQQLEEMLNKHNAGGLISPPVSIDPDEIISWPNEKG